MAGKEAQMTELTPKTERKIRELIRITEKNLPLISRKLKKRSLAGSPLTESAAKYYPALKKLAKE